jgi:hypothetical protein
MYKKISDRINRIYMCIAQVLDAPENLLSAGRYVCAFLQERHKNPGNPVNPVY